MSSSQKKSLYDLDGKLFSKRILECLKAPGGSEHDSLIEENGALISVTTGEKFNQINGVLSLLRIDQVEEEPITKAIKRFYEKHPLPSYEGLKEFGELVNKGNNNSFSRHLLNAIGYNKTVLECGCGTGQLAQYLQLNNNHVLGIDLSLPSLSLAMGHKRYNGLTRTGFAQMNIFDLAIKDESFDVVIAHGVLSHTFNPIEALSKVVSKVKPGGIIMVGLYNDYARFPVWLYSKVINFVANRTNFWIKSNKFDYYTAGNWFKYQDQNPHTTWHSINDALDWFVKNDVEYRNCIPEILSSSKVSVVSLFEGTDPPSFYQRVLTQLAWLGNIRHKGVIFNIVGRKRDYSHTK